MTRDIPYYSSNEDSNVVRLFIIRHGQTDYNVQKILQGHKDIPLNRTGFEQAEKLGQYLRGRGVVFDKIVSSDLVRCRQTVETVLKSGVVDPNAAVVPEYYEALRERYMGVIEGMYIADAEKYADEHNKGSFQEFGEPAQDFLHRLTSCIEQVVKCSSSVKNLAVVSHGGSIRTILRWLNYQEKNAHKIIVFNTSVTIVDYLKDTDSFDVRRIGNTQHLGDGEFIVSDLRLR